jgi:hypothetical protein
MAVNFPPNYFLWNPWSFNRDLYATINVPRANNRCMCLATPILPRLKARTIIGLWPPGLPDYLVDTTSNPCIPPGPTPVSLGQPWYYSPGICPSSYNSSCTTGSAKKPTPVLLFLSEPVWSIVLRLPPRNGFYLYVDVRLRCA